MSMDNLLRAFRDPEILRNAVARLAGYTGRPLAFMEVCGTHTMSIMRYGIKQVLPPAIRLISGPGCPVCVTESSYIDMAIELAARKDTIVATFGDLMRVPGSEGSLQARQSAGADVRIVYSPLDCLQICQAHPDKQVIFLSIGFETTTPAAALTVRKAREMGVTNFALLVANKTMPEALNALAADDDLHIDGFILPGHVCTIAGTDFYDTFCAQHRIPGVVAGFEPVDILGAILALVAQVEEGVARAEIIYTRLVNACGNPRATDAVNAVFEPCAARWRGIGEIANSGLRLKDEFASFDAQKVFHLAEKTSQEPKGCLCSEILKGKKTPEDCPLFGSVCQPSSPVGACMVSTEGTCAAYFKYRGTN